MISVEFSTITGLNPKIESSLANNIDVGVLPVPLGIFPTQIIGISKIFLDIFFKKD